jgi:hypothetical protein
MVGIFSLKFLVNQVKYISDPDVISKFYKNHGVRYNVRNKVDQVLLEYLSDIELILAFGLLSRKTREYSRLF